jgi:hypothetical protein
VIGSARSNANKPWANVIRFDSDGLLDQFLIAGHSTTAAGPSGHFNRDVVAIQPDGKLVVAGVPY